MHEEDTGWSHEIDHIISRKHGGSSELENIAYSCDYCNRFKGTDLAALDDDGEVIRLFHPRKDVWDAHFRIEGGLIVPTTVIGQATIRLLRVNSPERVKERLMLQGSGSYPRQ